MPLRARAARRSRVAGLAVAAAAVAVVAAVAGPSFLLGRLLAPQAPTAGRDHGLGRRPDDSEPWIAAMRRDARQPAGPMRP